ncbi:MAG: transposase [Bryobacterales bacterium]|nr:transposase [Bryobacterales bacterium]
MTEDWRLLVSFLPADWRALAAETGALKGLRKDKSEETLLRVLLLYLGSEHSLREAAAQAKDSKLADLSAVALWKRLKKSKEWLRALCIDLLRERGVDLSKTSGFQVRAVDTATVKEAGKTGSQWRIHYSLRLPSLNCDSFKVTEMEGRARGESLSSLSIKEGDHVLASWPYSTAADIHHVATAGGRVIVPLDAEMLTLRTHEGRPFDILTALQSVRSAGAVQSWRAKAVDQKGGAVEGRVCALRKSEAGIWLAHQTLRMEGLRRAQPLQPESFEFGKHVTVFSTFPVAGFTDVDILEWYRIGWQVELAFRRFKSIAQLGHLPKRDDEGAKAWLYGKLLVALLVEKLIGHASSTAPWGYQLKAPGVPQSRE